MEGYQHLGLDKRRDIYRLIGTGRSVNQVADALRRHPSTIYREIKRNRHFDEEPLFRGYFPTAAQTWPAIVACAEARLLASRNSPPTLLIACWRPGRQNRLRVIFGVIAVTGRRCATKPSTSMSTALRNGTISFGAICQLPAVRAGNVMAESRAVSIYPWQIRSARGRRKSWIAASSATGKAIS